MGLHEVMVSCDKCNEASIATILACNGELRRVDSYGGVPQLVYWIKTGSVLCKSHASLFLGLGCDS